MYLKNDTVCAYKISYEADIITPGASTVATFKTLILIFLEDFRPSQTQRQVNAFNMSGLHFPPNTRFALLCHIVTPPYSARRGLPRLSS